jgi:hypothetical protein
MNSIKNLPKDYELIAVYRAYYIGEESGCLSFGEIYDINIYIKDTSEIIFICLDDYGRIYHIKTQKNFTDLSGLRDFKIKKNTK